LCLEKNDILSLKKIYDKESANNFDEISKENYF
jgi:hypothetical protein